MGVGLLTGWVLARGAVLLINRLRLEYDGLYLMAADVPFATARRLLAGTA